MPWNTPRSEEHTSELQSLRHLVCRLLLAKNKPSGVPTAGLPTRPARPLPPLDRAAPKRHRPNATPFPLLDRLGRPEVFVFIFSEPTPKPPPFYYPRRRRLH